MRVNLIGLGGGWILDKFGQCMLDELKKMGIKASFTKDIDHSADINHYIASAVCQIYDKTPEKTSFMITHVDTDSKLEAIIKRTDKGAIGICMSKDTYNKLIASGVKRNKICYINPAQDGQIMPKKINLGFTHRTYNDNRKRESMILDICKEINPAVFRFSIMGSGWQDIVAKMTEMGFEVDYYDTFDKQKYNELILGLDYYCYFGFDEGSMGYLDAVAAGVGTIVTPQGYHLDTGCDITYPVETIYDIIDVLRSIQNEREKHIRFVENWTWKKYTEKHVEIWEYMLGIKTLDALLQTRGWYQDGIYSLLLNDYNYHQPLMKTIAKKIKGK